MPLPLDYKEAIRTPKSSFYKNSKLLEYEPFIRNNDVVSASGNYGIVFWLKHKTRNEDVALKCFLSIPNDQKTRYLEISEYLHKINLPYFCKFEYFDESKGITLENQKTYPVLLMEYIKGETLKDYLQKNLQNKKELLDISNKFLKMLSDLKNNKIAHGDLQDGNIKIVNAQIKLIDYDGMFVPNLKGLKSCERGIDNYQHPNRKDEFDVYLDNFSGWVIYLSIIALIFDSSLWYKSKAHLNDNKLLFEKIDFLQPDKSYFIKELKRISNQEFQTLINKFIEICKIQDISKIPPILDFTKGLQIDVKTQTLSQSTQPQPQYQPRPQVSSTQPCLPRTSVVASRPCFITINSIPANAYVIITDIKKGSDIVGYTPLNLYLSPGNYLLRVIKQDYEEHRENFEINNQLRKEFIITLTPRGHRKYVNYIKVINNYVVNNYHIIFKKFLNFFNYTRKLLIHKLRLNSEIFIRIFKFMFIILIIIIIVYYFNYYFNFNIVEALYLLLIKDIVEAIKTTIELIFDALKSLFDLILDIFKF